MIQERFELTDGKTLQEMFKKLDYIIENVNQVKTQVAVVITRLDNTDSNLKSYREKLHEHKSDNKESFKAIDCTLEKMSDKMEEHAKRNQEEHEKMNIERAKLVTLGGIVGAGFIFILKLLGIY